MVGLVWNNIKYSSSFNTWDVEFQVKDISNSDFILVDNLKWNYIKEATNVSGKGLMYRLLIKLMFLNSTKR